MPRPLTRAANATAVVVAIERHATAPALLADIPAERLARLRAASPVGWVALEDHTSNHGVLRRQLGDTGHFAFVRQMMLAEAERPLLRALVQPALRIFGRDAAGVSRWLPRAWQALFKDAGTMQVEAAAGASRIVIDEFPTGVPDADAFVWALAASVDVLHELTRTRGTTRVASFRGGRIELVLAPTT